MNTNSRYDEAITIPIQEEVKAAGVKELTNPEEVEAFFREKNKTAVLFINSVCGCSAGTARPGFIDSLKHEKAPKKALVSVFAGVHQEAVAAARAHFSDIPPSSPSIALFREGKLVYFIDRRPIESSSKELLLESLHLAYEKFFGDEINTDVMLKNPMQLAYRSAAEAKVRQKADKTTLLDSRSEAEQAEAPLPQAESLNEEYAQKIIQTWNPDRDLSIICNHDEQSLQIALFFRKQGFQKAFAVEGGYKAWLNA